MYVRSQKKSLLKSKTLGLNLRIDFFKEKKFDLLTISCLRFSEYKQFNLK